VSKSCNHDGYFNIATTKKYFGTGKIDMDFKTKMQKTKIGLLLLIILKPTLEAIRRKYSHKTNKKISG
jgi:hypothetical protein